MKPYPLDTSNHLMTPLSSITLATSSLISPIATRSASISIPDHLGQMLYAAVFIRLPLAAAPSAWRRPPNPLSKLRISLGSPVQSDKCSLCKTLQPPVNIFLGGGNGAAVQCAINGDKTLPISSRTTRSAISSNSVASRLRMTRRAPLRLAINGNPAAGHTTSDEPMARNRSHDMVMASARRIAASGIACPNDTVADLMCPLQSEQSGACPDALKRSLTQGNS